MKAMRVSSCVSSDFFTTAVLRFACISSLYLYPGKILISSTYSGDAPDIFQASVCGIFQPLLMLGIETTDIKFKKANSHAAVNGDAKEVLGKLFMIFISIGYYS